MTGSYIGTDTTGTTNIGNAQDGVFIGNGASANIVGTNGDGSDDAVEGNVISGNTWAGVSLVNAGTANVIAGNLIGTNASGMAALPNAGRGVWVEGTSDTRIGTDGNGVSDDIERNVISGNGQDGLTIKSSTNTIVAGNIVGLNVTGDTAVPNTWAGVAIWGGSTNTRVGTNGNGASDALERNVISGNFTFGVSIADAGTDDNLIAGNYIGTDATGTSKVGNAIDGVYMETANRTIVRGNVISGNARLGIYVPRRQVHHRQRRRRQCRPRQQNRHNVRRNR